jgi:MFS family permease
LIAPPRLAAALIAFRRSPAGRARVNVLLLTLCQALGMTANNILATTAALVGYSLLVDKTWATLPTALQMTGTMAAIVPASLLMARLGRRTGFTIGATIGAAGAATAVLAIFRASFPLFCLGTFLLGSANGFAAYYRFAAAETAQPAFRGKAISLVMAGGVAAAIFGPETAKWSRDLFNPVLYAGCYAMIVLFFLAAIALLRLVDIASPPAPASRVPARPLRAIVGQPIFIVAASAGMLAYGMMSLVMTATPLAMLGCGLPFGDTAFVIQWHALGMYAPSFVTGHLIDRFGATRIMQTGVVLLALCAAAALSGVALGQFWLALLLLGIGWNFLFIGSTALLTEAYTPAERAKTQAANDFLIFGMVALSSFSSGVVLNGFGWSALNLLILPFAGAVLILLLLYRRWHAAARRRFAA